MVAVEIQIGVVQVAEDFLVGVEVAQIKTIKGVVAVMVEAMAVAEVKIGIRVTDITKRSSATSVMSHDVIGYVVL